MTALAAQLLAFAGLGCLSLSMHRHAGQASLKRTILIARLRPIGWAVLAASLVVQLAGANWRFGLVEWIGQAGLAVGAIALLLLYAPLLLPRLLKGAAIAGTAALVAALVR